MLFLFLRCLKRPPRFPPLRYPTPGNAKNLLNSSLMDLFPFSPYFVSHSDFDCPPPLRGRYRIIRVCSLNQNSSFRSSVTFFLPSLFVAPRLGFQITCTRSPLVPCLHRVSHFSGAAHQEAPRQTRLMRIVPTPVLPFFFRSKAFSLDALLPEPRRPDNERSSSEIGIFISVPDTLSKPFNFFPLSPPSRFTGTSHTTRSVV